MEGETGGASGRPLTQQREGCAWAVSPPCLACDRYGIVALIIPSKCADLAIYLSVILFCFMFFTFNSIENLGL